MKKMIFFTILAALSISVLYSPSANAWSSYLPSCNIDNWDFETAVKSAQYPTILTDTTSFIVAQTSTSEINVYVTNYASLPMQIRNNPAGSSTVVISSDNGNSSYKNYRFSSPNRTWIQTVTSTTTNQASIICIQYANNIDYSTLTVPSTQYPEYDFNQSPYDVTNNYTTTNNSTVSDSVSPIDSNHWYNPNILLGEELNNATTNQAIKALYLLILSATGLVIALLILFAVYKSFLWFFPNFWKRGKE